MKLVLGSLVGLMLFAGTAEAETVGDLLDQRDYSACYASTNVSGCMFFTAIMRVGAPREDGSAGTRSVFFTRVNVVYDALNPGTHYLMPFQHFYESMLNRYDTYMWPFGTQGYDGPSNTSSLPATIGASVFVATCQNPIPGCPDSEGNIVYPTPTVLVTFTATPEPATWMLLATGLLGVGIAARRHRHT